MSYYGSKTQLLWIKKARDKPHKVKGIAHREGLGGSGGKSFYCSYKSSVWWLRNPAISNEVLENAREI